ncbi:hypothetical protein A6R68_14648 [Neotoma lepida]|uniref:MBD domain-containing protein n=1 Tax=Neotoma lepida TaxID=56216 RepID=A0A1A6H851_NEOLE|nr:hypothetical protein A6R68_14648 [Neotoma lepida]
MRTLSRVVLQVYILPAEGKLELPGSGFFTPSLGGDPARADQPPARSPSGKKFRSKPQLARYLGGSMDLSTFDFRTGKMLMNKMNKSRQRVRYDSSNQVKVRAVTSGQGAGPPG